MFKAKKRFEDVVIQTQQLPSMILELWPQYRAGFEYGKDAAKESAEEREQREQREHDAQMREMDRELERRRRGVLFSDERERPGLAKAADEKADDEDIAPARAAGERRRR
jgi:hypothetical protein